MINLTSILPFAFAKAALVIIAVLVYLVFFWYAYILVMGLYRAHLDKRLTKFTTILALPALVIGYAMDILANIFIASLVFLELPKELLVTTRLQRYAKGPINWRRDRANWICTNLLDLFDPTGNHC